MPDLDDLLRSAAGIERAAAEAADVPSYDALARRGERRRNVRHGLVALGSAAVVAIVLGLVQVAGGPGGEVSPGPAETPTVTTSTDATDPVPGSWATSDVAGSADGQLVALVRATGRRTELVVTDDGFATDTRFDVPEGSSVATLDDRRFLLAEGYDSDPLWVVDGAGDRTEVTLVDNATPLITLWETPVVLGGADGTRVVAVDPDTAVAHRVPLKGIRADAVRDAAVSGMRVTVLTAEPGGPDAEDGGLRSVYHWSDDGGRNWQEVPLDDQGLSELVPTAPTEPHLVIEGVDGATVFPFVALHRMEDGGSSFERTEIQAEQDGFPLAPVAHLRDGELVVVARPSGARLRQPVVYRVDDDGTLTRTATTPAREGDIATDGNGVYWAGVGSDGPLFRTEDDSASWTRVTPPAD